MAFEWDEAKSAGTRAVRGFDFDLASRIFNAPTLEILDDRWDYGEERWIAVGAVEGRVLSVVYTMRGETRRIISARRASRKERLLWQLFASR